MRDYLGHLVDPQLTRSVGSGLKKPTLQVKRWNTADKYGSLYTEFRSASLPISLEELQIPA
jgi:hypothetical protein